MNIEKLIKKYRPLIFPLGIILSIFVLMIFSASTFLQRIQIINQETAAIEQKIETLDRRLSVLRSVEDQIETSMNLATLAIPHTNPSTLVIRKFRELIARHQLSVDDLSVSSPFSTELSGEFLSYQIDISVSGQYESMVAFTKEISQILPLVNISSLSMERRPGSELVESKMTLVAHSAALPENLPDISEPIPALSSNEVEIMALLAGFEAPSFSINNEDEDLLPIDPKANPFSAIEATLVSPAPIVEDSQPEVGLEDEPEDEPQEIIVEE